VGAGGTGNIAPQSFNFHTENYVYQFLTLKNTVFLYVGLPLALSYLRILPIECIYRFCIVFKINSDCFRNSVIQLILLTEKQCVFFKVGTEFYTLFTRASCLLVVTDSVKLTLFAILSFHG
jgi:hypothetical protein